MCGPLIPTGDPLNLPGGFLEQGELPEQAAVREIMEEIALSVDPSALRMIDAVPGTSGQPHMPVMTICFELELEDAVALEAHDDAAAAYWLPFEQLRPDLFPFDGVQLVIERWQQRRA